MENISLDDMRLFVAVVQAGSLSHAQELTNVPVSKLSRRLTRLEQALGTKLLNRGKKGVSLNEVGERFFIQAQTMLQQAQFAIESVQNCLDKPRGLLRISVASDIFHTLVQPYLNAFLQRYPDVNLEINISHKKVNMIQDGVDLAVRVGTIDNENVVAKAWRSLEFGLFASADYVQQHGIPNIPNDLYQHQIISQRFTLPWLFSQEHRRVEITPVSRVSSNDFRLVENQIRQGVGLGILPMICETDHSDLVRLLSDWHLPSVPISLIYYKNRGAVPTIRSFIEFLQKEITPATATLEIPTSA